MSAERDPKKWVVSRTGTRCSHELGTVDTDTERFRTLSNALLDLPTENDVVDEVGKLGPKRRRSF